MKRVSAASVATIMALHAVLAFVPSASADHITSQPVDDVMHDHVQGPVNETADTACRLDPAYPEGLVCAMSTTGKDTVYCAVPIAEDLGEAPLYIVETLIKELWPAIKNLKCWITGLPAGTVNWWNGDAHQWWRGWWCFATLGGSPGGYCQGYDGPTNPHTCVNTKLECEKPELYPRLPSV